MEVENENRRRKKKDEEVDVEVGAKFIYDAQKLYERNGNERNCISNSNFSG